uniref:GPI transamidase subunit PIG-U n=1 Tax=Strongyloides stercoralis TaxID=6248 RepID=A0A0K0EPL9_STRER
MKGENEISKFISMVTLQPLSLSILLKVISYHFWHDYLIKCPEFVVATNSFERLKEGAFLKNIGEDPYDGDIFHMQPLMLMFLKYVVWFPRAFLLLLLFFDTLSAFLLRSISDKLTDGNEKVKNLVFILFLLNPMAIGTTAALSTSTIFNFFVILSIYYYVNNESEKYTSLLALLTSLNIYYFTLLSTIFIKFPKKKFLLSTVFISMFILLHGINYTLSGNSFQYIQSTYMFQLKVPELYPDVGLFWYMFCEVFQHFETFFLTVFQIHIFIYMIPLAITLKRHPFLLLHVSLIIITCFTSYPSYGDAIIYLSLLPTQYSLFKKIKKSIVIFGALISCLVLFPTMWTIWMIYNAGNANFYFSLTLVYSLVHIFIASDMIYAQTSITHE